LPPKIDLPDTKVAATKVAATKVELPTASEEAEKQEEPAKPVQPPTQSISVVVRVDNGLVVEAYIKERRSNLAAYEATALQLARQRRYPKNTNLTETIRVQITREQ
jgi:hypothetical protein